MPLTDVIRERADTKIVVGGGTRAIVNGQHRLYSSLTLKTTFYRRFPRRDTSGTATALAVVPLVA